MSQDLNDKITTVMSAVLAIPDTEINENTSPESVEHWDSLKHMNLVVALEEEFDIEFDDDEIMEMNSYPTIVEMVGGKL